MIGLATSPTSLSAMLIKSRAIVLHTFKYNDTSSIAVLFTEERGMVSFVVHLPKSHRSSRKPQLFHPLALLEVEWAPRDKVSLQSLRNVSLATPYCNLPYDPAKASIAFFLSEFLYHSLRGETANYPLFEYITTSFLWLDTALKGYANFHLVFLMRLSRFLGFYPNTDRADSCPYFDLLNSCFTLAPPLHGHFIDSTEAQHLPTLLRMNYDTMHLFSFTRSQRNRLLDVMNSYYSLHIPDFPHLKSLDVLRDLFG